MRTCFSSRGTTASYSHISDFHSRFDGARLLEVRAKLAAKRKTVRAFDSSTFISRPILLLDVNSDYPYRDPQKVPLDALSWRKVTAIEHYPGGIKLQMSKFSAYIGEDEKSLNIAPFVNEAIHPDESFWTTKAEDEAYHARAKELHAFMEQLPKERRGNCEVLGYLPYERIIDIDGYGDSLTHCPIVYVEFREPGVLGIGADAVVTPRPWLNTDEPNKPRFERGPPIELHVDEGDVDRILIFPEHMRKKVW